MESMSPKKKMTKTTTTTTKTLYVPNDIIIDILSWVPAKSLLRLRWACKYWFHLITRDHDFIMKQFHRSHNPSLLISKPFNPHLYYPCKIFQCYIDYSTTTTSTSGSFPCEGAMNPILSGIFVDFEILGSCHGLILFSYYLGERNETILCIWNPCTKEYKYLPKPLYNFDVVARNFGLGYDHSIQDYKVICNVGSQSVYGRTHVQVYTLRTNSWRNIESSFSGIFGNGMFVNGALYFTYTEPDYPGARRILSLDLEKEMYVKISNQPVCLNDKAKFIDGLTMFEGSLCLTMHTGYITSEAWVMKKDMNNNQEYSWSKLYEIRHIGGIINHFLQHLPLRNLKDGEILLLGRREGFRLFDPKNNIITIHKIEQTYTVDRHKIEVIYTESLVSLNSGTYIDEKGDYMHYWQE